MSALWPKNPDPPVAAWEASGPENGIWLEQGLIVTLARPDGTKLLYFPVTPQASIVTSVYVYGRRIELPPRQHPASEPDATGDERDR